MKNFSKYQFLLYPLVVFLFIVFSANLLFDPVRWEGLMTNQTQIADQERQIGELKMKLEKLNAVNLDVASADLKYLVSAMPNSKMVWFLVSELKLSASEGAAIIEEYKGEVGRGVAEASGEAEVVDDSKLSLKTNMLVSDISNLRNVFASLDKRLPLVKISKIEYENGALVLVTEGAWSPSKKTVAGDVNLPDYQASVTRVKKALEGFVGFPEVVVSSDSGEFVVDPF